MLPLTQDLPLHLRIGGPFELFAWRLENHKLKFWELFPAARFSSKSQGCVARGKPGQRCMARASASHEASAKPRWRVMSVRAVCCSAVTRPLGLHLRSSVRNEARAVESHLGSDDRNLCTVLLSAISNRSFMYVSAFTCAFRCMRVAMRARSSPMYHGTSWTVANGSHVACMHVSASTHLCRCHELSHAHDVHAKHVQVLG